MSQQPGLTITIAFDHIPNGRRYWKGNNGGGIYKTVAPNSLLALAAILAVEHRLGTTDDITGLEVEEISAEDAATMVIRGDGSPDVPLSAMPMFEVACSEWP